MNIDKINLKELKSDIDSLAGANRNMKKLVHDFEIENKELIDKMAQLKQTIKERRDTVVVEAMAEFEDTDKKTLLGGIGIRERTIFIYDTEEALRWGKDHDMCILLDKTKFEKLARAELPDFVVKDKEAIVTFPKEIDI